MSGPEYRLLIPLGGGVGVSVESETCLDARHLRRFIRVLEELARIDDSADYEAQREAEEAAEQGGGT